MDEFSAPSAHLATNGAAASETAICLFAFIEDVSTLKRRLSESAISQDLLLHRAGSVVALVGVAPISDFCGPEGELHLQDANWLAPRVRRHAEIVQLATLCAPVFPAPFATLYSNLASLDAFMRAHEATITDFFGRVANAEEWELRTVAQFNDPDALDRLACSAWPDWRGLTKGARYIRLCRDKSALIDIGRAHALALANDLVAQLSPLIKDVRRLEPTRASEPSASQPVARHALLVHKRDVEALKQRVEEISEAMAQANVRFSLAGPWPPFSFRPNLQ